jgi:hypothetical protein
LLWSKNTNGDIDLAASLHGLCSRPACRRRRACSGEPRDCLSRYAPLVPEDAREGAKAMIAAKWRDRSFEELIDEAPDEVMALADWANAVARSGRPRCGWGAD